MSITQGHVFGLNLSQTGPINACPEVNHYKDMGILRLLMEFLRISDVICVCIRINTVMVQWRECCYASSCLATKVI